MPDLQNYKQSNKEGDWNVVEWCLYTSVWSVRVNSKEDSDLGCDQHQVGKDLVNHLNAENLVLVVFDSKQAQSSNDATYGKKQDNWCDGDSHRCMHVVLDKHKFDVANDAIEQGREKDYRPTHSMQPHICLPPVLHVPVRCHLEQPKEGPYGPQGEPVNKVKADGGTCHNFLFFFPFKK